MSTYYAFIDGLAVGPSTVDELLAMEAAGTINDATPVRSFAIDEWSAWYRMRPEAIAAAGSDATISYAYAVRADAARADVAQKIPAAIELWLSRTHYPALRAICLGVLIIDVLAAVIFAIMGWVFYLDGREPLFLTLFILAGVCLFNVVPLLFGFAFLDLVDAVRRSASNFAKAGE